MGEIDLLDCTLRDGGYVNDWMFGREAIKGLKTGLEEAGADIIELGFFRENQKDDDRSVFSSGEDISRLMSYKKPETMYSAMIEGRELSGSYPPEKLGVPDTSGIDLIRICIWKRLAREHLRYCREIKDRGYKISVQPTAVNQYSEAEFVELLNYVDELRPYAFYIVDTWGTQSSAQIKRYVELAEKYLDGAVKIGYHGHNNKMQALSCAEAVLKMDLTHDLCLDASIMGMGRGIGNLQTEVIMDHLNENYGKSYDKIKITMLYQKYLKKFYEKSPWGYTMYHFLSALYKCSPDYASYFRARGYGEERFHSFLKSLTAQEKAVFNKEFTEKRLMELDKLNAVAGEEG